MAGDIGGRQCRNDDQAPAVGEKPLGGLHWLKGRFPFIFLFAAATLCGRETQFNKQSASRLLQRERHAA
jgi:hypothetical protein